MVWEDKINKLTFENQEYEFYYPIQDSGAWHGPSQEIFSHIDYMRKLCKGFNTIIQAGGNAGLAPLIYSKIFKFVYTWEPDAENFYFLNKNTKGCNNIFKFNAALGPSASLVSMNRTQPTNVGMHTINNDINEHIPMMTIDDLVYDSVNIIHFDIEGSEPGALQGAKNTIMIHRPIIMVENGNSCKDILNSYGYEQNGQSHNDMVYLPREQTKELEIISSLKELLQKHSI